jgi:hypothetical protein
MTSYYYVLHLAMKRILTMMDIHFNKSILYKNIMSAGKHIAMLDRVIKLET